MLAVTVLTSMDGNDLEKIGIRGSVEDSVVRLATIALANGCQGVVASAREASTLRAELGDKFAIVTPGVRPAGGERWRSGARRDSGGSDRLGSEPHRGRAADHGSRRSGGGSEGDSGADQREVNQPGQQMDAVDTGGMLVVY